MSKKQIIKIIFLLILLIFFIALVDFVYSSYLNKKNFEDSILSQIQNTDNSVFSIDKITFFSSCNATSTVNANSSITIENLCQFTDIAIFINNNSNNKNYSLENTLKEVYIENVSFINPPSLGEPALYYQTLEKFATGEFLKDNKIVNIAKFDISSDDVIDYSSTALHNNCANPITLSYVNSNISKDYTISNAESFTYNGTLLKTCNIPAKNLECAISFDIFIINNLNKKFKCPVYFEISLVGKDSSIVDGTYIINKSSNFIFYEVL